MSLQSEEGIRAAVSALLPLTKDDNFDNGFVSLPLPSRVHSVHVSVYRRSRRPFEGVRLDIFLSSDPSVVDGSLLLDRHRILAEKSEKIEEDSDEKWDCVWRVLSERLGAGLVTLKHNGDITAAVARPTRHMPHIHPVSLVLLTPEAVAVVSERSPHVETLREVLLHAHCNVGRHTMTLSHLHCSLLECARQLASLHILPVFDSCLFSCDDAMWLECCPVRALLSMRDCERHETQHEQGWTLFEWTESWRHGRVSNLSYLLALNAFAGRKRGDVHNHPIVPWVCDFTSKAAGHRPLDRTKYRLQKGDDQLMEMYRREPAHHIPELLSDIGYMIYRARVETRENLCKHVRSKWVPREYPLSLHRMFEWTPDECIPELYEDPSLLVSVHGDMPSLELPSFTQSPEDFIAWHRSVLEGDHVSHHLHQWIDLAFGCKLSLPAAEDSLNVHLHFVEHQPRFTARGVVQLFHRPHPARLLQGESSALAACLRGDGVVVDEDERGEEGKENDPADLVSRYKQLVRRQKNVDHFRERSKKSLVCLILETSLPEECRDLPSGAFLTQRWNRAQRLAAHSCARLKNHLRSSLPALIAGESLPPPSQMHLYLLQTLNISPFSVATHDHMATFYAFHNIRRWTAVDEGDGRWASALHREMEAAREAVSRAGGEASTLWLPVIERHIGEVATAIPALRRVFPVLCRVVSEASLRQMLGPLKRLLANENSVKLLDRRFLVQLSVAYGARVFLVEIVPPLVEAVAGRVLDRSIVAKESIMWLAKRYGPVVCARFISAGLLRIHAACYANMAVCDTHKDSQDVFSLPLDGDEWAGRVEAALSEIAASYSLTFVTVQYLPFGVDLVEQATRRLTSQLEPALLSVLRITRLSMRAMSDSTLMNYLEDCIMGKIVHRVCEMSCDEGTGFSGEGARRVVAAKAVQLLLELSLRIGPESAKVYARDTFSLLFDTFACLYDADEELVLREKEGASRVLLSSFPLWFVSSLITRFAAEWGVPLLSSFCKHPAFLVPFVSQSSLRSTPSHPPLHQLSLSGNRLSSGGLTGRLSGGTHIGFDVGSAGGTNIGGVSCSEECGSLGALWCARVKSAVWAAGGGGGAPANSRCRLDQLTLCHFTAHASTVRRIAVLSNENSFLSASSDKTVRLWSVRPEVEQATAQYTYKAHSRPLQDVCLLASNLIASTDGTVHVWDPFRSSTICHVDWPSCSDRPDGVSHLTPLDRHTLAAASALHGTVRILDTRCAGWAYELRVSPNAGTIRSLCAQSGVECGEGLAGGLAVALSSGTLAVMDARTGRVHGMVHGGGTHVNTMRWQSATLLAAADPDHPGVVVQTKPQLRIVTQLPDNISCIDADEQMLTTISGWTVRMQMGEATPTEIKLKSEVLSGSSPSSLARLPLNDAFLIGTSNGSIRLMC